MVAMSDEYLATGVYGEHDELPGGGERHGGDAHMAPTLDLEGVLVPHGLADLAHVHHPALIPSHDHVLLLPHPPPAPRPRQ